MRHLHSLYDYHRLLLLDTLVHRRPHHYFVPVLITLSRSPQLNKPPQCFLRQPTDLYPAYQHLPTMPLMTFSSDLNLLQPTTAALQPHFKMITRIQAYKTSARNAYEIESILTRHI